MKRIFFYIIVLFVFLFSSCLNEKEAKHLQKDIKNLNSAKAIKIAGKIEIGKDNIVCIVTNWKSRSRVSYHVYGKYQQILSKNIGKIAMVSGKIIKEQSPWSKTILIESIIKISENMNNP